MKKILFTLQIMALSMCAIVYGTECPSEKTYIKSNPEAMDKYKEEFKNGEIRSLYYDASLLPEKMCVLSSCIYFEHNLHDFFEFKYADHIMKGVYTSYWAESRSDKRCKHISQIRKVPDVVGCFYIIKNDHEKIKSKYGISIRLENGTRIFKFYNVHDNTILYEASLTYIYYPNRYKKCKMENETNNNPSYKFDPFNFPAEPLEVFYQIKNIKE